jgi:NADPH-dependent 2,4-dienoyl-CoA reductase/sulfur reductase-like enzyme
MANERRTEVLIVGAGPAGMAAAASASRCGTQVTVLDMNVGFGGQIWRAGVFAALPKQAQRRVKRLGRGSIEFISQAKVVALGDHGEMIVETPDETLSLGYDKLILATGARELFLPFPGWTTPNIMGAGGLQVLVKTGLPIAGKRVAVAGSGPLLLAVAASLRKKGADVRLIAEQASAMSLASFAMRLPSLAPGKIPQGIGLKTRLLRVSYHTSCWPISAAGSDRLSAVTFRRGTKTWTEPLDYLACGFGLVPNSELPVLCGCRLDGQFVQVDRWQRTSAENIYCAGEPTGIGGLEKSLIEGEIAGFVAAGNARAAAKRFRKRRRAQQFAAALAQTFALRAELKTLADEDTFVCRCEDIAFKQVKTHAHAREAKIMTRCGMGHCQGRICGDAGRFLFDWEGQSIRPPILPTPMENLVDQEPT